MLVMPITLTTILTIVKIINYNFRLDLQIHVIQIAYQNANDSALDAQSDSIRFTQNH